jgi:hypothetical protein
MVYDLGGVILALAVGTVAWQRSRSTGGFYDREVYGMAPAAHRRYALVSLGFATFFVVAYGLRSSAAGLAGLALYALIAVFYATSFLQGAPDRDE